MTEVPSAQRLAALRIIDAEFDRASEGLRVVEEYARYVLEDRFLTERLKSLRHRLAGAMNAIPADHLLAGRDTARDVGTGVTTPGEYRRDDLAQIVRANLQRVQQALRSLEEYAKLLAVEPQLPAAVEAIRYETYTLEKALLRTSSARERLADCRLYVLIDGRPSPEQFESLARSLVEAGVDALQLRDKSLDDRSLLARARKLRQLTRGTATLLIVNDRPDLAALSQADGVHVGQEELPVGDVRKVVGPDMLIGVSTHNLVQARQAVLDGADYLGCGPTFPSSTKAFDSFPGLSFLQQVAGEIALPAFAIGGIDASNVDQVLSTGLRRIAVSSAIVKANDPARAAISLREKLA